MGAGFWLEDAGPGPAIPSGPLPREVDVAIVGGGYTGLWCAYYLRRADPSLSVAVFEADRVGSGASGRNGGWVSAFFSGAKRTYARRSGRPAVVRMQRELVATVDEVGRVLRAEGIDADYVKGGTLALGLGPAQLERMAARVEHEREWGMSEEGDVALLGRGELAGRLRAEGALGALHSPHVARVHPGKLVHGLASVVLREGAAIHEETAVRELGSRRIATDRGSVSARWIVRATEGYTGSLRGAKRALAPMNSSMIVTEPVAAEAWEEIGWQGLETVSDGASVHVYMQRTRDDRIAIGGRGRPYRYGSRLGRVGSIRPETAAQLARKLSRLFPAIGPVEVAAGWSGVLGVPRDWCPSVSIEPATGVIRVGGFVGQGLAMANLAGRTVADLVTGEESPLTGLAWVGRTPPRWEPEPLRYAAIRGTYALYGLGDGLEARTGRPSRLTGLVDRLSGRH